MLFVSISSSPPTAMKINIVLFLHRRKVQCEAAGHIQDKNKL